MVFTSWVNKIVFVDKVKGKIGFYTGEILEKESPHEILVRGTAPAAFAMTQGGGAPPT